MNLFPFLFTSKTPEPGSGATVTLSKPTPPGWLITSYFAPFCGLLFVFAITFFGMLQLSTPLLWASSLFCVVMVVGAWLVARSLARLATERFQDQVVLAIEPLTQLLLEPEQRGRRATARNGLRSIAEKVRSSQEGMQQEISKQKSLTKKTSLSHDRFLRTINEDVRSSVHELISGLKSLSHTVSHSAEQVEVQRLYGRAFSLLGALNDALEVGGPEQIEVELLREVSLGQLCQDLIEQCAARIDNESRKFRIFVDQNIPSLVLADPHRLLHLIGNLVENAERFTNRGTIDVRVTLSDEISSDDTALIKIAVVDSGEGIPAERLSRMTTELAGVLPDQQSSELGLGLRAAAQIAHSMSGSVLISSREGRGTKVSVTIRLTIKKHATKFDIPSSIVRFASSSQTLFTAICEASEFHGLRAIPVESLQNLEGTDTIFVDGRDLINGKFVTADRSRFPNMDRFVVLLATDASKMQASLTRQGFTRFLNVPFISLALLRCLVHEDVTSTETAPSIGRQLPPGLRILVVDDVATNRLVLCDFLRSQGQEVLEAEDGIELVELATGGKPLDAIFTDITMKNLDGISAVQMVRRFESLRNKRTPIFAMTAYAFVNEHAALMNAGFDGVLIKPVKLDDVIDLLCGDAHTPVRLAPAEPAEMLDLSDLKSRTQGRQQMMARVLGSFLDTFPTALKEIREAQSTGHAVNAAKNLHTLKGLLLEVGATSGAKIVEHLEHKLRNSRPLEPGDIEQLDSIVRQAATKARTLHTEYLNGH